MNTTTVAHTTELTEADVDALAEGLTSLPSVDAAWTDLSTSGVIRALPTVDTPAGVTEAAAAIEAFGALSVSIECPGRTELVARLDAEVAL